MKPCWYVVSARKKKTAYGRFFVGLMRIAHRPEMEKGAEAPFGLHCLN